MEYRSTRGVGPGDFRTVTLEGLAPDGGLYIPQSLPQLTSIFPAGVPGDFGAVARGLLAAFTGSQISDKAATALAANAYENRFPSEVAKLRPLDARHYMLELFHGPTLAFKDIALQLLAGLFDHFTDGSPRTILGATSGDTGSAAIEALRGKKGLRVIMLHPKGRVSEFQRRQMTTVLDDNVFNLAIEGSFDDCQRLVKASFADEGLRARARLTAVNSINWARVMAQATYFITSSTALSAQGDRPVFSVPTGNFGDILAGHLARAMGAPIGGLIIASNANNILPRLLETGVFRPQAAHATLSPAMDIQLPSNFERYLAMTFGPAKLKLWLEALASEGAFSLTPPELERVREDFGAVSCTDKQTIEAMQNLYKRYGYVADPHTAVGFHGAERSMLEGPHITLATAHPAKFSAAVKAAIGDEADERLYAIPARLDAVLTAQERYDVLPADFNVLQAYVERVSA